MRLWWMQQLSLSLSSRRRLMHPNPSPRRATTRLRPHPKNQKRFKNEQHPKNHQQLLQIRLPALERMPTTEILIHGH